MFYLKEVKQIELLHRNTGNGWQFHRIFFFFYSVTFVMWNVLDYFTDKRFRPVESDGGQNFFTRKQRPNAKWMLWPAWMRDRMYFMSTFQYFPPVVFRRTWGMATRAWWSVLHENTQCLLQDHILEQTCSGPRGAAWAERQSEGQPCVNLILQI